MFAAVPSSDALTKSPCTLLAADFDAGFDILFLARSLLEGAISSKSSSALTENSRRGIDRAAASRSLGSSARLLLRVAFSKTQYEAEVTEVLPTPNALLKCTGNQHTLCPCVCRILNASVTRSAAKFKPIDPKAYAKTQGTWDASATLGYTAARLIHKMCTCTVSAETRCAPLRLAMSLIAYKKLRNCSQ